MSREKRMVQMYSSDSGALTAKKQDRNTPCKCGSGKKAKNCCGCETEYFKPKNPRVTGEGKARFTREELESKVLHRGL